MLRIPPRVSRVVSLRENILMGIKSARTVTLLVLPVTLLDPFLALPVSRESISMGTTLARIVIVLA